MIKKLKFLNNLYPRLFSTTMDSKLFNDILQIYNHGIDAVIPSKIISNNVILQEQTISVCTKTYNIEKGCYAIGFGKAALGMAIELERILDKTLLKGIISVPFGSPTTISTRKFEILEGAKDNLPDDKAVDNAQKIVKFVQGLDEDSIIFVLISGGGSALLPYPKSPITLEEKLQVIKLAVKAGADIQTLNILRSRLSMTKGGGLARLAYPRELITLILSDVVGDDLNIIASGPTTPPHPNQPIQQILQQLKLDLPPKVVQTLLANQEECQIPIANKTYTNVNNFIIGNNEKAAQAVYDKASILGYHAIKGSSLIQGHVNEVIKTYIELIQVYRQEGDLNTLPTLLQLPKDFKRESKSVCLIFGGETTVVLEGHGLGGRNQHMALEFSIAAKEAGIDDVYLVSVGTDGIDGPTDAAGAIGFPGQIDVAMAEGLNPSDYLLNNDSYHYFSKLSDGKFLIKVGHTGTNVSDLHMIFIF